MNTYRLFQGTEAIALHTGRVEIDGGCVKLYDHLGLVDAYAIGQWTFIGRVEGNE